MVTVVYSQESSIVPPPLSSIRQEKKNIKKSFSLHVGQREREFVLCPSAQRNASNQPAWYNPRRHEPMPGKTHDSLFSLVHKLEKHSSAFYTFSRGMWKMLYIISLVLCDMLCFLSLFPFNICKAQTTSFFFSLSSSFFFLFLRGVSFFYCGLLSVAFLGILSACCCSILAG